jgi:hypothetical protein
MKIKEVWKFWIKPLLILLPITMLGIWVLLSTSIHMGIDFNTSCNAKYGDDNWILNETTGHTKNIFGLPYIGQSWECVKK